MSVLIAAAVFVVAAASDVKHVLSERYDLANRPARGVFMSGGKPVQEGVRVKLKHGVSWTTLDHMAPAAILATDAFPEGFRPLPYPLQLPNRFLSERPERGDVSQGKPFDFPSAPKLRNTDGKLDPGKATESELRGQATFFGRGQCASCHVPPHYTDNASHDLHAERFYTLRMVDGPMAAGDGPVKTPPLRGIKDSPPYLHDGRLLTLDDTVEFFNLVLQTQLTDPEKADLIAFLRTL
jgi:hypothetical protein